MIATQKYPATPERQDAHVAVCWEPVGTAYAELFATVTTASSDGQGRAA